MNDAEFNRQQRKKDAAVDRYVRKPIKFPVVHEGKTISGIRGLFDASGVLKMTLGDDDDAATVAEKLNWGFKA